MLPIGNLTMFLSVPPSYQYLHSPFIFHHSPFTIHSFTIHHSPIHSFSIRSSSHFSFGLLRKSTLLSEEHPKDYRTTSEGKWKRGGQIWSNVDKRGQTWTKVVKSGQTWTNMDRTGQTWTKVDKSGQNWSNNAG